MTQPYWQTTGKAMITSKTFWASLVSLFCFVVTFFHSLKTGDGSTTQPVTLDDAQQAALVDKIMASIGSLSAILAIIFRGGATSPITGFFSAKVLLPFAIGFMLITGNSGCAQQQISAYREALNTNTDQIRNEHLEWARALATDPKKLPNLFDNETQADRDNWLRIREGWHDQYKKFIDESRANDSK